MTLLLPIAQLSFGSDKSVKEKILNSLASSPPQWNPEDIKLISSGLANTSLCTSPKQAKVFLANTIISRHHRIRSGHLKLSPYSSLKKHVLLNLQTHQIFGRRSFAWSHAHGYAKCHEYLVKLADSGDGLVRSEKVQVGQKNFEAIRNGNSFWSQIEDVSKRLDSLGATVIIQGSQSDRTTTSFSDIDLVLFGDTTDSEQQRLKKELDKLVLTADPLQHHGIFFYDIESQNRYSESVLPLATFKCATAIVKPVELCFQVINDKYSAASILRSFVFALRRFAKGESVMRGMYDWKFKISQVLLVPALLAAVHGNYLYKGDSFSFAKNLYSSQAWATISRLTEIRSQWKIPDQVETEHKYALDQGRVNGKAERDFWTVPNSLAAWKDAGFLNNTIKFLDETTSLAGLA